MAVKNIEQVKLINNANCSKIKKCDCKSIVSVNLINNVNTFFGLNKNKAELKKSHK